MLAKGKGTMQADVDALTKESKDLEQQPLEAEAGCQQALSTSGCANDGGPATTDRSVIEADQGLAQQALLAAQNPEIFSRFLRAHMQGDARPADSWDVVTPYTPTFAARVPLTFPAERHSLSALTGLPTQAHNIRPAGASLSPESVRAARTDSDSDDSDFSGSPARRPSG